jgi:OmpA-OmpF porin, OOP family
VNWLADHGVDRTRLSSKGYGPARPVASNSTADGRAKNRRVELSRL